MIPEPFTYVVAGFGIAMTLASAAASTLESAKLRIDKFREYDERIRQVMSDIQSSDVELESCLADWRDDRKRLRSLEDCAQLFGEFRRHDLEEKIYQIISALAKVQHILLFRFDCTTSASVSNVISGNLRLSAGPVVEEAWDWLQFAERKRVFSKQKPWALKLKRKSSKYKVFLRAKFTVWDGEQIKQRTERLQKAVGDFRKFTDFLSKSLPALPAADLLHSTFADRVAYLVQLEKEWSSLSSVMNNLSGPPFAVLPRLPDDEGRIDCLRRGIDVTTCLLVETSDEDTQITRKSVVYVSYLSALSIPQRERRSRAINGDCKNSSSSLQISCPQSKGKSLKELYNAAAKRPFLDRLRLQRRWELERAETVISLITWTVLLWRTPWARCICTARLRRYPPRPGRAIARISMLPCAAEGSQEGCSFEAQYADAEIVDLNEPVPRSHYFRPSPAREQNSASKRTMISLAVSLCEMALLTPIEIPDINHQPLVFNCGRQLGLSEDDLLDQVQRVTSRPYRGAVQKCFEYADPPICDVTICADIIVFAEKVLVPFAQWKSSVLDKRNNAESSPRWYAELPQSVVEAMEV